MSSYLTSRFLRVNRTVEGVSSRPSSGPQDVGPRMARIVLRRYQLAREQPKSLEVTNSSRRPTNSGNIRNTCILGHFQGPIAQQPDRNRSQLQLCVAAVVLAHMLLLSAWLPGSSFAFEGSMSGRRDSDTLENIPGVLSRGGSDPVTSMSSLLGGPKGKEVETCTRKCVPTCIRGGGGAPGLGPISVRKEVIVFKEGFRTRQYCLSECAQVCSLSYNGPSGPPPRK